MIYRKNGDTLSVDVQEVDIDAVKYKLFNETDGPLYSLDKQRILKIVYRNGREETFSPALMDPELYVGQKNKGIKINFLAPLLGYSQFTYEQSIKPGQDWEATLGIIGLGKNPELEYYGSTNEKVDARGVFFGAGYKFIRMPNFVRRGERMWHVLHGSYIKPHIVLGTYTRNVIAYGASPADVQRKDIQFGALLINIGRQWVLGDIMLLDIYFGLGYSFDNTKDDDYLDDGYKYAFLGGGDSNFGVTAGIKIGIML